MSSTISANVQSNNKPSSFRDKAIVAGAVASGGAIGMAVPTSTILDSFQTVPEGKAKVLAEQMSKMMPEIDTFENTAKNINQIMQETGLSAKGVKFSPVSSSSPESLETLKGIIEKEVPGKNKIANKLRKVYYQTFSEGMNAAYFPDAKNVVVNQERLYSSAYHEVGHALNANGNFFTKALQKGRILTPFGVSVLAPITLAVGLLHKVDKNKPEEEKGKVEKTLDFISNNAGKITLASYVPLLAEEGLASYRGVQVAKKYLDPTKLANLKANYVKAWGTYALAAGMVAGGVALGIALANGIKNKFVSKNETQEAKQA